MSFLASRTIWAERISRLDKKKILLVSLGHLSCDINGGALPATLPYLRAAHNLDYQATGGLILAYSCLSSLIQPLFGLLADKHNKPWFIPAGIALAGLGLAVMGFLAGYWAIFAGIAVSGIGSAFFHPEGARFANRVSGKSKGTGLSLFSIGGNSGFIIGPLLVTVFVGSFGLHGMAVFGVIGLVMAFVLVAGISRMPASMPPINATKLSRAAEASADDPAAAEGDELAKQSGKVDAAKASVEPRNNWREFSKLVMVIVSRSITFAGCNTFIPLYWVNVFGQSKAAGAMALVIMGACGVACNMAGGILSDKIGQVRVIRLAFSLMAPVVLVFGLAGEVWQAYALLPFLGLVIYMPFSSQVVLGQTLLAKNIGFASGITLGLATTLGGIAQPCLGWLADSFGLHTVFLYLSCASAMGGIFAWLLRGEKQ